jgi:hypothetical protein
MKMSIVKSFTAMTPGHRHGNDVEAAQVPLSPTTERAPYRGDGQS